MQIGQGAKLDRVEKMNQKADNFSAAPQAHNDRRFLPISYDHLFHSRAPFHDLFAILRVGRRVRFRHFSRQHTRINGTIPGEWDPLEGKFEGDKKRTVLAPHPCPQNWSLPWNFGYHVRSSAVIVVCGWLIGIATRR
jgi:hypothetical protein